MAYCENCGALLGENVKFCGQCGAPVKDGEEVKNIVRTAMRSWSRGRSSARNADTGCRDMTRLDWEKMNWKKPD